MLLALFFRDFRGNPVKDGKVQRPGTAKRRWSCVRSRGTGHRWLGEPGPASGS